MGTQSKKGLILFMIGAISAPIHLYQMKNGNWSEENFFYYTMFFSFMFLIDGTYIIYKSIK